MSLDTLPLAPEAPPHRDDRASGTGSDYAELSRRISRAGLMRFRPGHYLLRIIVTAGLFAAAWTAVVLVGDSWWTLLLAGALAVLSTQIAFLGHDVAHRQVFRGRRAVERFGLIAGNFAIGLGYGWWMDKHTRHHANPNHEEKDPDVSPGVLSWTPEQARSAGPMARLVARIQAYLFFPLLLLEGLNLKVQAVRAVVTGKVRRPVPEGVLLAAGIAGYLAAVFLVLSPGKAVLFIAVQQGLFGLYMGSSFAPNHKGMPIVRAGEKLDYLRRQVLTSRNVRGGFLTDLFFGGLNYQIEHHLFPSMPRPHLRRAQPIVRQYCAELGIPYLESSALSSYAQALRSLHENGAPLRAARATS